MRAQPGPPDWGTRLRRIEEQIARLVRRDGAPARETIVAQVATWATTSAADYTDLVYLTHLLARNYLTVQVWAFVSGGGAASVQLWDFDTGAQIAALDTTSATQTQLSFTDVYYTGRPGDRRDVRVRGRTTAGTLSVLPIYAYCATPLG